MIDPPPTQPSPQEVVLWQGRPSQWIGGPYYLLTFLFFLLLLTTKYLAPKLPAGWVIALMAIAILPAFWKFLTLFATHYRLTTQRLSSSSGVWVQRIDEVELYRVRDTVLVSPLWLRLIGRGHVILETSDLTTPRLTLYAIANPTRVRELVRENVELVRQAKGVRSIDLE